MKAFDTLLWLVLPYVAATVLVVGSIWRYRYDKFGWTTRSSQLYESRLLRLGSPLFHFGILQVFAGHVIGLLIPSGWTAAIGLSEHGYHLVAVTMGSIAGLMTCAGLAILSYRRLRVPPVTKATTPMDKVLYVVLGLVIGVGTWNTIGINLLNLPGKYPDGFNYRETISVWFRGLFTATAQPRLMAAAPLTFQLHVLLAMVLTAIWPFTRLVHVFSVPLGYLSRPYLIYRARDPQQQGAREPARGWEPIHR